MSPIQRHGQKPEEAREKIVELIGDLPKVELFARNKADGWDVWGNEVQSDLQLEETKMLQYQTINPKVSNGRVQKHKATIEKYINIQYICDVCKVAKNVK